MLYCIAFKKTEGWLTAMLSFYIDLKQTEEVIRNTTAFPAVERTVQGI